MSTEKEYYDIGALIFPNIDQCDVTGPFEVLSRIPNSTFHLVGNELNPVRDVSGLTLTPQNTFANAPALDVLLVPGGAGQEDLMDNEIALSFIRDQARNAQFVLSVCTGALLCGAAGLLRGRRATTHWSAFHLLEYFGAIPTNARVVVDGKHISAAGVTAGIDGALRLASLLCGDDVAQQIQLSMEYSPDPPFSSGSPQTAPPEIVEKVRASYRELTSHRCKTAKRVAARLGINLPVEPTNS